MQTVFICTAVNLADNSASVGGDGSSTSNDVLLKMKPHFNILYQTLSESARSQWEHIGPFLNLDPVEMDVIKTETNSNMYLCLNRMLKFWLKQDEPLPTKSKIIEVLRHLKFNEEADRLEKELT